MSATRDLIAAALRLTALAERNTDDRDEWQHSISEVREMCARAMVQPDMAEVEKRLCIHENVVRMYANGAEFDKAPSATRTALLDYVRGVMAELDALLADNERLSGLYEQAVKGRADMRSALRDARAAATQPVSVADVPMPEADCVTFSRTPEGFGVRVDALRMDSAIRYGDAREAAGYARGLVEAKRDAERYRWLRENGDQAIGRDRGCGPEWTYGYELDLLIDAALRGEVKP